MASSTPISDLHNRPYRAPIKRQPPNIYSSILYTNLFQSENERLVEQMQTNFRNIVSVVFEQQKNDRIPIKCQLQYPMLPQKMH